MSQTQLPESIDGSKTSSKSLRFAACEKKQPGLQVYEAVKPSSGEEADRKVDTASPDDLSATEKCGEVRPFLSIKDGPATGRQHVRGLQSQQTVCLFALA